MVEPSDWANPSGKGVVMGRNRGSEQWGNRTLHNSSGRGVGASGSAGHDCIGEWASERRGRRKSGLRYSSYIPHFPRGRRTIRFNLKKL